MRTGNARLYDDKCGKALNYKRKANCRASPVRQARFIRPNANTLIHGNILFALPRAKRLANAFGKDGQHLLPVPDLIKPQPTRAFESAYRGVGCGV